MNYRLGIVLPVLVGLVAGLSVLAYLTYRHRPETVESAGPESAVRVEAGRAGAPPLLVNDARSEEVTAAEEVPAPGEPTPSVGIEPPPQSTDLASEQPRHAERPSQDVVHLTLPVPGSTERERAPGGGAGVGTANTAPAARSTGRGSGPALTGQSVYVEQPLSEQTAPTEPSATDQDDEPTSAPATTSQGVGLGPDGNRKPDSTPEPEPEPEPEPVPSTPLVQMIPTPGAVVVGDTVRVAVVISSATDVGHTPFHVTFDPRVLVFEYGEEGSFLTSDGHPTAFFAAATSRGDAVVVGLSRLGRVDGIDGSGELCTLTFTAVGPGNAGLDFSRARVKDSSNTTVASIFEPVTLIVRK